MRIPSLALTIVLLAASRFLAAETPTLFVSTSMYSGNVRELVYEQDTILSELVWPLNTLTTVTARVVFPLGHNFFFRVSLEGGSLLTEQTMSDSDYMNTPASGEKTHFSKHPVTMHHYMEFRGAIAHTFTTPYNGIRSSRKISITPSVEFRWASIKWMAKDGYIQYAAWNGDSWDPWTSDLQKTPLSGNVISWSLTRTIITLSLSAAIPVSRNIMITGVVSATPFIYCTGKDIHILTDTVYKDVMSGGFLFEPGLQVAYQISPANTVFASCTWTLLSDTRGDTTSGPVGGELTTTYKDGGGTDMNQLSVSLGYRLTAGKR